MCAVRCRFANFSPDPDHTNVSLHTHIWQAFAPQSRVLSRTTARVSAERVPLATLPRFRKGVKQVATLGPKTFNKAMIEKLFLAGVDVFRLNLSHGAEDKVSDTFFPKPPELETPAMLTC